MRIDGTVCVRPERLSSGLSSAIGLCRVLNNSPDDTDVISFSDTTFITPTFALPMLVFLSKMPKRVIIERESPYMSNVRFKDGGMQVVSLLNEEFLFCMSQYEGKNYIPISRFPVSVRWDKERNEILSIVESVIARQTRLGTNTITGIKYMMSEIVDNMAEHSHAVDGLVFAQAYPHLGHIDICLADDGITILGSYKHREDIEIETYTEALKAANSGVSSKNRPSAENRGYGISTTRRMIVSGLGGQYLMASGNAVFMCKRDGEHLVEIPGGVSFGGTIVAFRIPLAVNKDFDYTKFIE